MTGRACQSHPATAAEYRCDGCERLLCEECVEVGHRLLFCCHCGEQALPVVEEDAANSIELARQQVERRSSSMRDALMYPFRGRGGDVFLATYVLLGVFMAIESVIPLGFLLLLIPRFLIAVMMPGLLFVIVRSTARGEEELPDWPDWFDGERMREFLSAFALGFFTLMPAVVLLILSGCGPEELLAGSLTCWLSIYVGLAIGFLIWIPAFAGVAAFGAGLLVLRLDLHIRAFFATAGQSVRVALLTVGLAIAGELLALILSPLPLVGRLGALGIDLYAMFVSTHLIGLLLRKHERDLELDLLPLTNARPTALVRMPPGSPIELDRETMTRSQTSRLGDTPGGGATGGALLAPW